MKRTGMMKIKDILRQAKRANRLKLIFWDGTSLVMIYKRQEKQGFAWPAVRDGTMHLNHARFEALFAGLAAGAGAVSAAAG